MSTTVGEQTILDALHQVPPERWDEVLRFLDELKEAAPPIRTAADLANSELVGLWADRTDITDNHEFARHLRQQAETRSGQADDSGQ